MNPTVVAKRLLSGTFRRACVLGVLVAAAVGCGAGADEPLPPLTIDALTVSAVTERALRGELASVDELLEALPDEQKESLLLMESTASRHRADVGHPRVVLYGPDARFVAAMSTDPEDPLYDTVEMFDLDEDTGLFNFAAMSFGPEGPRVQGAEGCTGCHGGVPRPIWGEYPNWPGAYGPEDGVLTDAQAKVLAAIRVDPGHRFHFVADFVSGDYHLRARHYSYPNTNFNFELGSRAAEGLHARAARSPAFARWAPALLALRHCDADAPPAVMDALDDMRRSLPPSAAVRDWERVYEVLGLDLARDFLLAVPASQASLGDGYDLTDWNQGTAGLGEIVEFLILRDLLAEDAALAAVFSPVRDRIDDLYHHAFELRGSERARYLVSSHDEGYFYLSQTVYDAALGSSEARAWFCGRLAERWWANGDR